MNNLKKAVFSALVLCVIFIMSASAFAAAPTGINGTSSIVGDGTVVAKTGSIKFDLGGNNVPADSDPAIIQILDYKVVFTTSNTEITKNKEDIFLASPDVGANSVFGIAHDKKFTATNTAYFSYYNDDGSNFQPTDTKFEITPFMEFSGLNPKLVSGDKIYVTFPAADFLFADGDGSSYTTTPPAPLTFTVVDAPHYTGSLEVIAHVPASASTDKLPGWTLISGDVETHYDSGQVVSFDFTDPSGSADVTVSPDFADELGGVSVLTPPSGPVTVSTQGRRTVHFFYNPKGSIFGAMTGPDNNAFDQGSFKVSGVTGTFKNGEGPEGLAEGSYEITYQDVDGYVTPQPKTVNVVRNVQGETNHFSANGTYTKTASGTLAVTIQPDKLAGARWYVDGNKEVTYESGKSVVLAPGSHTVSCTEVSGYQAPESQTVTVADGKTLEVTMKYTQPVGEMAKLLVNIKPAAVSADAQWTVDSATSKTAVWHKSGEEVELAVTVTGEYTITFKDVKGYKTPVPLTVKVEAGKTKTVDATYQPAGSGGSGGGCNAGVFPAALLLLAGLPLCLRKKK